MKRITFLATLTLVTLLSVHAQRLVPVTVRQYLDERHTGLHQSQMSRFAPSTYIDGRELVEAFVSIDNAKVIPALAREGVMVTSSFDEFVTALIPPDRLERVALLQGVNDVEVSTKVKLCTDSTLSVTNAGQVIDGSAPGLRQGFDGSGVIVGIIDVGFDYQHRAFKRQDNPNESRIVRVYNTHVWSGHPAKNGTLTMQGSVFMGDEIQSLTTDKETETHGTHTASIAAGCLVDGYGGMAPGADIVLCAVNVLDGSMSLVEVANCIKYVKCYADSVAKPFVISISVSTTNGPHDGSDYLSKAIAQIMGPGRLIVIAAGNNGDRATYAHRLCTPTQPINLLFKYKNGTGYDSAYYYHNFLADIWVRNQSTRFDYKFHVLDTKTNQIVWESEVYEKNAKIMSPELAGYYNMTGADSASCYIQASYGTSADGKKYHISISVRNLTSSSYTTSGGIKKSRYAMGMSLYPRAESEVDAWVSNDYGRFGSYDNAVTTLDGQTVENFYSASNSDCTIGTYAVHDSIISAGAYIARNGYHSVKNGDVVNNSLVLGQICDFSSYQVEGTGPTGQALPTVCAPGNMVVAAGNRYSSFATNGTYTVMSTDDGSYWCIMSGTSMATPTVAGILAQWLQACPTLSVSQTKEIIAQTAIKDAFTQGKSGFRFGPNGKIDALAGINLILQRQHYGNGDVDRDGVFGIDDVTSLIDYLLNNDVDIDMNAADVDHDGRVNVDDLTTMIDMLLSR